jgi:hypothetical protein
MVVVVEVVVPPAVVVVVTGSVVVVVAADEPADTIASTVVVLGAVGVTPVGSKAIVIRMYSLNLILVGSVVRVGFFWEIEDQ